MGTLGRSGDCHRRNAVGRVRVAQVIRGGLRGRPGWYFRQHVAGFRNQRPGLGQVLVGQHHRGRLQGLGQPDGPFGCQDAVGMVQRAQHEVRCVTVHAVQGHVQVRLLGLGRQTGGRSSPHHVDDHRGRFRGDRETDALQHQRQARAGGGGHRRHAAEGSADHHVDRGQFVLGLQQLPAQFLESRRQPFEQVAGRRDRVSRGKADTAPQRAQAAGFTAV